MADGTVHIARVLYLPYVEPRYFPYMTASPNLSQYIKDNGETKRVGTLAGRLGATLITSSPRDYPSLSAANTGFFPALSLSMCSQSSSTPAWTPTSPP